MEKTRQNNQEFVEPAIAVERQVYFIQAIFVLVGVMLGSSFSQWFYMLDIIIGLELLVASLTGECWLNKILSCLPWNKPGLRKD